MDKLITIVCVLKNGEKLTFEISPNKTIQDLKEMIKKKIKCYSLDLYFKDMKLNPSSTIFQSGLRNNDTVFSKNERYRIDEAYTFEKEKDVQEMEKFMKNVESKELDEKNKKEVGKKKIEKEKMKIKPKKEKLIKPKEPEEGKKK